MSNLYNDHSGFKQYGLGTVAKDKELGSWEIEVYPQERITNIEKPLGIQNIEKGTYNNAVGTKQFYQEIKHNTVTASWLPIGDYNRVTPPDVCQGETVMLWTSSGTDNIYWSVMFNQLDLRKTELALWEFSSKPHLVNPMNVSENTYSFLMDTKNQAIRLKTSKENGEATAYTAEMLCKLGELNITDSENNAIKLNSPNGTLNVNVNNEIATHTKLMTDSSDIWKGSGTALVDLSSDVAFKISGKEVVEVSSDQIIKLGSKQYILNNADVAVVSKGKSLNSMLSQNLCEINSSEGEIILKSEEEIFMDTNGPLRTFSFGLAMQSNGEELIETLSTLVQGLETYAIAMTTAFTTALGNLGAPVEMADAVAAVEELNTTLGEVKAALMTIKGE